MADIHGMTAPGFEAIRTAFAQSMDEGLELGAGFAAVIEGRMVANLWAGHADRARTRPWAADTIVPVYSTTKPIAALVMVMLADRGMLDLEAPVAAVWPEFGAHGKDRVTVAQALSHQAGVPGFLNPIDPGLWLDPPALSAALAALEPMWQPGTAHGYHPLTFGYIAGEIVRRVAGRSLGTILREDVCAPHGIDFHIGTPASEHARCAEIARPKELPDLGPITPPKLAAFLTRWAAPDRGGAAWRETEIPSANGHGTAAAIAQLYGVFANGGQLEDRTLFGPDAMEAFARTRSAGPDLVLPFDLTWALGVQRNTNGVYGPNRNTFGHSGWGGSFGLADPDARLSASYVMNRQSNKLQGDPRARRLIDALYACL